jgi:hypothetical protein
MIRLRHLSLRSLTAEKKYGADLRFEPGLNIIQAGNTSGKSTCLQSIIYALGLERSLGPRLDVPLPHAMQTRIHATANEPYQNVLASYVELEIENASGEILVVHRDVVGGADRKLIKSWNSPRLSKGDLSGVQRDFFVHDGGGMQREDGFHNYLCRFLGWDLPNVTRFDGSEGPLYLEVIFPMFFVEQKRGWSAVQGPFPTFFRIQDVARRVMEFLLDLDAGKIRRRRAELRQELSAAEQAWAVLRRQLAETVSTVARLIGIPTVPTAEFLHEGAARVEALQNGDWRSIDEIIENLRKQLSILSDALPTDTETASPEMENRLERSLAQINELRSDIDIIRHEYNAALQEHQSVSGRLSSLQVDLRRNQDALKLKKLGSEIGQSSSSGICPTCHQDVQMELMPSVSTVGMGLEQNILFVQSQIDLYQSAELKSKIELEDLRPRYASVSDDLREKQQEIRTLRQALIQPSDSPSRSAIEEEIRLQLRLDRLISIREAVDGAFDELKNIAARWAGCQDQLKAISGSDLSEEDVEKISFLQNNLRNLLSLFAFRSFPVNEITLSSDNLRPLALTRNKDGDAIEQELGFEMSASDAIRMKWAYYLSMQYMSDRQNTNHIKLTIFDEPGQQEIELPSLNSLFRWSAEKLGSQQFIAATSEPLATVYEALGDFKARVQHFDGFILQPIKEL